MAAATLLPREEVLCDICQIDDAALLCEAKSLYSEEQFPIVRCRRCSLIYVNPRQDERAKLAQLATLSTTGDIEEHQTRDADVYRQILSAIGRYRRPGSLLDVGSATGGLLREAREAGWDVTGVEPARYLAEFAAKTYGLRVHAGTLEEARFSAASFDAVVMVHVIEHVYHPAKAVAEVFRVLKPGGVFLSLTPDFHHYAVRLVQRLGFFKDADRLDPTAHPYYFTPKTHATLVREQGFRVLRCGSPISGLFASRNGHGTTWSRRALRYAAWPAVWTSRIVPIGSTIHCLAQKPSQ